MAPNRYIIPIYSSEIFLFFSISLFLKGEKQYWTLHPDKTIATVSTAKTNIYLLHLPHCLIFRTKKNVEAFAIGTYSAANEIIERTSTIPFPKNYLRPDHRYLIGSYIYFEFWIQLPFIFTYSPTIGSYKGVLNATITHRYFVKNSIVFTR